MKHTIYAWCVGDNVILFFPCLQWVTVDTQALKCLYRGIKRLRRTQRAQHKVVREEIETSNWPQVNQVMFASHMPEEEESEVTLDMNSATVN